MFRGWRVAEASRFFKIPPAEIVVIHDEIDLRPGKLRVKLRRAGTPAITVLRSIDALLGQISGGSGSARASRNQGARRALCVAEFSERGGELWVAPLLRSGGGNNRSLLSGAPDAFLSEVARRFTPPETSPAVHSAGPSRTEVPQHGILLRYRRLPNVGKSTLFNALTATAAADAANYPFCTIEPNFRSRRCAG